MIKCNNLTIKNGGKIDVTGKGYRGGCKYYQGESLNGIGIKSNENNCGGGGGGYYGGGGGYGTIGQNGDGYGKGGSIYGNDKLDILYLGSGGGGGGYYGSGGSGGGVIKIMCKNQILIEKNANILSNGGYGGDLGGGGSGGTIYLICKILSNYGNIYAKGGDSQYGVGGNGRIRLDYFEKVSNGEISPHAYQQVL